MNDYFSPKQFFIYSPKTVYFNSLKNILNILKK